MVKADFSASLQQSTLSFRNHSKMRIWCSKNIHYYYQCWKQLCTIFFRILWWMENSKEQHIFEIESFVTL